jgi:hypothetical protein
MGFNEGMNMLILFAIGILVLLIIVSAVYMTRNFWASFIPGDLVSMLKSTYGIK